ncbi:hypothetical protein [Ascidiimonas aurantiaca]|uniref:hypothetical protein n=1 Tax=Ascidiimonas aurantiaca TaxID=1685432 RepID=UPI0030EBC09D
MKKKKLHSLHFKKVTISHAKGHLLGGGFNITEGCYPPNTFYCESILICPHTNLCPNTDTCVSFFEVCDTNVPNECFIIE